MNKDQRIIIFGNSGSGKTTLAKYLCVKYKLAHLDLDNIAWMATSPPKRLPIEESETKINAFLENHHAWLIEGCYTDLLELVADKASQAIFLNPSVDRCIANAKNRPWEPHKYASKEAQDANLEMLVQWIKDYHNRSDTFSYHAHHTLYDAFEGKKIMYTDNINYDANSDF